MSITSECGGDGDQEENRKAVFSAKMTVMCEEASFTPKIAVSTMERNRKHP